MGASDLGSHEASFEIEPSRSAASAFADRLAEFCEAQSTPPAVLNAFQVALDEVLTNIIDYSGSGNPVSTIHAHVRSFPGGLEIAVEDDGIEFDPLNAAPPDLSLDLDDRPIGGLGIYLVKSLMDELGYQRINGRNRLSMKKSFPTPSST